MIHLVYSGEGLASCLKVVSRKSDLIVLFDVEMPEDPSGMNYVTADCSGKKGISPKELLEKISLNNEKTVSWY